MTDSVAQHMPPKNSCQKQKKSNGLEITTVNKDKGWEVGRTCDKEVEDVRPFTMKWECLEDTVGRLKRKKKCGILVKVSLYRAM